jgi:predicted nucleotidyltransferase
MQKIHKDKADILRVIREKQPDLTSRFTVRRIGVFGSFATDSANPESDVDILVELAEPTFDHYMDLKFFLEEALNRSVDLVMADTVKPHLRPIISEAAGCVFDRMLWLNPSDNQGVRFWIQPVKAGKTWEEGRGVLEG